MEFYQGYKSRLGGLWRWGTGNLCCISTLISACYSRSAPTVRARTGPHPGALPVRVRYRRATPLLHFFFLSRSSFFSRYSTRSASIFRFITSLYKNGALSLYFTIIADTNISMHGVQVSEQNARHLPPCSVVLKSTEIFTIRGTLRLTSLSSIWAAFGACQEMICIDQERTPTVAGDLGINSRLQTFSTRVQRPSRQRPEALSQEESGFTCGQRTLTTSVLLVWGEPSKRS